MAEDTCISVIFEDDKSWDYCWSDVHPDPAWKPENIVTGLRAGTTPKARAWRTCQYYLKGMSPLCVHWTEGQPSDQEGVTTSGSYFCNYIKSNTSDDPNDPKPEIPTGFNNADCDFLGRRSWCSNYEGSVPEDLEEWICAGPNPYITGLGEKTIGGEAAIFRPISRNNILGYNDAEGNSVGKCDCYGMGRGEKGCGVGGTSQKLIENALSKLPIVCNFYRPQQMGFGIIEPASKRRGDVDLDGTITDQGWKSAQSWEDSHSYRLPLNYELYNQRAAFQKCQWWNEDKGREYLSDDQGTNIYLEGTPDIFDDAGRVEFCKCTDSAADDFNTRIWETQDENWQSSQMALREVWSVAGGPVCNGARPECPYYSGKWEYLKHEKMLPGMPVTANQILELRFWLSDWDSQKDYDDYFSQKPNFDDDTTPSIYTFSKWEQAPESDFDVYKMLGKKLTMCQPAPLHQKEFSVDYIEAKDVEYYTAEIGTTSEDQRHFPTLVRDSAFQEVTPLVITYPYYNDDVFELDICEQFGAPGNIKRHNNIYGDRVKVIGQTIRNKKIYVINTAQIEVNSLLLTFPGVYGVRGEKVKDRSALVIKNTIYNILTESVNRGFKDNPDYIKKAISDSIFGYFRAAPVKLNYEQVNRLLICVDLGDGTWEYRWRQVNSKWCGGVIKQTEYLHEYINDADGYINSQPESLGGSASAEIDTVFLNGTNEVEILSAYSKENILTGIRYYGWSIQEITVEEKIQQYWATVGNSNKIWVELEDININYVYTWDVESAYLKVIMKESEPDEDGNVTESHPRAENVPDRIELKKILVDDDHIPPSACLLEPVDDTRIRFLSSEWELYVTYKYEWFTNENPAPDEDDTQEKVILYGAGKSNTDRYLPAPYTLSVAGAIEGINKGAVQLIAHFKDEDDGRIISAFATKLLINIVRESCRNVDIFYSYAAEGKQYFLRPETGMCIDIKSDGVMRDTYKHAETPNCGDHEHSWITYEGPMWFPYNICRGYDMYDEWTICNNCQAGYVGPINDGVARNASGDILFAGGQVIRRNDYRYCGPYKYHAFGAVRGNWASSCDCGCRFWYSDASLVTPTFAGYARIKTTVSLEEYAMYDWVPPPFGNDGREYVEKYVSQDYISHSVPNTSLASPLPVRSEWMPLMLDHSVFFSTFNAYDSNPEDEYIGISEYYNLEPFRYTSQMNMGLLYTISEAIDEDDSGDEVITNRFRWEELFEVHHEGNCSYPLPSYPISDNSTEAIFYYLKDEWGAWAWQELWKDIERNVPGEMPVTEAEPGEEEEESKKITKMGKMDFLEIVRPLYITDVYKGEHRRIMNEAPQLLVFKAPKMDDTGAMLSYPTLSINKINERPFEILYDEDSYTGSNFIIWKDEGGSANTDGSSSEDNIYEKTRGGEWLHDENTLFDEEAASNIGDAATANRKVPVEIDLLGGPPIYKYFNRGLVVNIPRDRLYYLPKEETEYLYYGTDEAAGRFENEEGLLTDTEATLQYKYKSQSFIPGTYVWKCNSEGVSATITTVKEDLDIAVIKLNIKGKWGYTEGIDGEEQPPTGKVVEYQLVRPGVSIRYEFIDESSGGPTGETSLGIVPQAPELGQELAIYDINLEFLLGPIEMITRRVSKVIIEFSGVADSFISVDEINLSTAKYVDVNYEWINVWERKYISSTFTDVGGAGINLDGPGDNLHYQTDLNNSGQYVDLRGQKFHDEEFIAIDKTKFIATGVRYPSDIKINDIAYDTLHEIEKTNQKNLYEYAHDLDTVGDYLDYTFIIPYRYKSFLEDLGIAFPAEHLTLRSDKLSWKDHRLFKQFQQYDFWRPGGHFYSWTTKFTKQKCWAFGDPDDFFEGHYTHVDHVGIGNPLEADPSKPIDPGNSYYSLRFYTQQAKYDRAMILSGGDPEYNDRMSGVTSYNGKTFI